MTKTTRSFNQGSGQVATSLYPNPGAISKLSPLYFGRISTNAVLTHAKED